MRSLPLSLSVVLLWSMLGATALAQRPSTYSQIEIWGLTEETREEFIARLERQNGIGAEAACMAVLRDSLGYRNPGVYVFPNPTSPDSSTLLITLREVPPGRLAMASSAPRRSLPIPEEWSTLRQLANDSTRGLRSQEFQCAALSYQIYAAGDTARVGNYLDRMSSYLERRGGGIDIPRTWRILGGIAGARPTDPATAIDIYLHSSNLDDRRLASFVLLTHLGDDRVIAAFVQALWDQDLATESQAMLSSFLRQRCSDTSDESGPIVDAETLGEILNHPDPVVADLGLALLQCGPLESAYLREALEAGAKTLKDYLRSELVHRDFRSDAIEALRKASSIDLGDDADAWIRWIESGGGVRR